MYSVYIPPGRYSTAKYQARGLNRSSEREAPPGLRGEYLERLASESGYSALWCSRGPEARGHDLGAARCRQSSMPFGVLIVLCSCSCRYTSTCFMLWWYVGEGGWGMVGEWSYHSLRPSTTKGKIDGQVLGFVVCSSSRWLWC